MIYYEKNKDVLPNDLNNKNKIHFHKVYQGVIFSIIVLAVIFYFFLKSDNKEYTIMSPEQEKEYYQEMRENHRKLNISEEEIDEIIETTKKIMEEKN